LAVLPEGMKKEENISLTISPLVSSIFEEDIALYNKTFILDNNNSILNHNPYALVLSLVPVLTIFGLFLINFKNFF
jgi:hypothetical protein